MHPDRVQRDRVERLTDLPNIGPRIALALQRIGVDSPNDLRGRDAFELYQNLCIAEGERVDPCALDVMISITRFLQGDDPKVWWAYTAERKKRYPDP